MEKNRIGEEYPRILSAPLQVFVASVFEGLGIPEANAAMEAEGLVWANLRGIDSHGVQRVGEYAACVDQEVMNPRPDIRIEKETAAILRVEADFAFGPVVTIPTMEQAIAKAREVGIGWALIRITTHQGVLGYYAQMAACSGDGRDCLGVQSTEYGPARG